MIITETRLGVPEQKYVRDVYCRFRLGISDLCHNNRYNEDDTLCPMCKTEPENEIQFLLKSSIRKHQTTYIPANNSSANVKEYFKVVMSNEEPEVIPTVAKFLCLAFKRWIRSK